jgi:plasmid stabilization system protein ParE
VQRVFAHVEQLAAHPNSGSKPPELRGWRYRQIIEPPCRVLYREDHGRVLILYVMRSERHLRLRVLAARAARGRR